jgi:hypothetical protein
MVLWACAPGVALVTDVVVEVDVEVEVEVDGDVLLLELQPTSARPSATVTVAAVRYFIYRISRSWAGTSASHAE